MNKRLLAIILSVFMIMVQLCAIPVSAAELPANIGTDYVAGEVTGNAITTENLAGGNYVAGWGGGAATTVNGESVWQVTTGSQVPDTVNNSNGWGVLGRIVGDYTKTNVYEAGKNVVVSYQAKVDTGSPVMKISLWQSSRQPLYAMEYPGVSDGVTVTNTDWQTYSHTLAIPETGFVGANNVNLCIGLAYTGNSETKRGYYIKGSSVYVGKEYAYDIEVTASRTAVVAGETFTVDADVVNQGGVVGGISQEVSWYALNSERTAQVDGITITEGANGKATVSISPVVAEGTYDIVAVADVNNAFVKGISISVTEYVNPYVDYIAGEVTGNVLGSELTASLNYNGNSKREGEASKFYDVTVGKDATTKYTKLNALRDLDDPHKSWADGDGDGIFTWDGAAYNYGHALSGGILSVNFGDGATKKGNIVYKFNIKNGGSVSPAVVNIGRANGTIGNTSAVRVEYPTEYNSKATGVSITSTDWTEFAGTFENKGTAVGSYTYVIGLAQGNSKGALVWFDSAAYMGLEYAHDISVTADKTEYVSGEAINVEAQILNQVGLPGGLTQDIVWRVMNTDRTVTYTEGFTITPAADGKAEVSIDPFLVDGGDYDIVAYSQAHGMAKGVTITVPDKDVISTMTLSDFSQNTVTANVNLKNTTATPINAVLVVFMVNERNQITDIETAPVAGITSADGKKVYTLPLTATDISKVVSAKACLFDCGTQTLPTVLNSNLNELAPSLVALK